MTHSDGERASDLVYEWDPVALRWIQTSQLRLARHRHAASTVRSDTGILNYCPAPR